MAERLIPPEADAAQRRSSDPAASVWVSANAGAGKTYVLAQRVVRLLLSGVAPRTILCLTYTNAAAAEMASRVYGELAGLATMAPAALRARVAVLAPGADPDAAAERARTLFAETLETPGGLKVQTIHAFAAALLRRFPLEANVSGAFQVLDDATREELTDSAIATVLARAAHDPAGGVAGLVDELLPHVSDASLSASLRAVLAEHQHLKAWVLSEHQRLMDWVGLTPDRDRLAADLAAALAVPPVDEAPAIEEDYCRRLHDAVLASGKMRDLAERIAAALGCPEGPRRDGLWRDIFFTQKGEPRGLKRFAPAAVRGDFPDLDERVAAEQERLERLAERHRAEAAIAATLPLVMLGWDVLAVLEADKRRRGLIDYDDQIERAMHLVRSGSAAAWVRFKLDEGIDHVMVDEAQDTSPPQWDLVGALTEEFFAGVGAREAHRTLFVVGDEKQSIYSFQGAAPRLFAEKRAAYEASAADIDLTFHAVELAHSMRSAPQVLAAVDRVFARPELAAAVGAPPGGVRHLATRQAAGGVDVWPLFASTVAEKPGDWDAPFDETADEDGPAKLVQAIADQIERWMVDGPDGGPPIRPGDVLILARKREPFATLMNRELKRRGIPAAGADRLDVTEHIAVKDMVALARALISRDDLSLAAVLRGPLFGFSDEALFRVAHGRAGSLFAALAEGDAAAREAHATLVRWRRLAATGRPFDLFAGILAGEGRRADFAARMGSEAEDALDAFLDIALDFESRGIPALETFLMRLAKTRTELRRSTEGNGDTVRVMTAHGSKGLEAPVVFLADVGSRAVAGRTRPRLVPLRAEDGGEVLLFAPTRDHKPMVVAAREEAARAAEQAEHYRLLYVGMTRAERHLVVCGAYRTRTPEAGMWHEIVGEALAGDATPFALPGHAEPALAFREPAGTSLPSAARRAPTRRPVPAPDWLRAPAIVPAGAPEPLAPSEGEHETAEGEALAARPLPAAEFGDVLHALMERDADAATMAARVAALHPTLGSDAVAAIVAEARAVMALPELAAPKVRREVAVIGDVRLAGGAVRRASGRIDRLQIDGNRALIVDFKTDRVVPASAAEVSAPYRRQLAIYRALVRRILPGHHVETALVWTAVPRFMRLDGELPEVSAVAAA
ncbi:double-strand break repair helicase AddA [Acuticoccus mangrovi]|uniref:DNA 3'-5' helicase n=1 Tax=Acuticoccus mangrovi TaxID=2796142 RepID=A0A934IQH2_9HYPH|nr:double-strand break repair helicase AddA [Acuticoccus mangrovi]MBJ3776841.1 double-strand break repair helicase AddA [Acuticoccus mangrovi]